MERRDVCHMPGPHVAERGLKMPEGAAVGTSSLTRMVPTSWLGHWGLHMLLSWTDREHPRVGPWASHLPQGLPG